ncbi:hypothetical protein [Paracoccus sp. (in: a-proteobacteria)]|uniref:hypothetical protein n=1 Tax=Paracoccus sp. TaxID=267 RepID=UPI002B002556|nr:hypothetical protein [Paracoccus sp. (in: a-proteobacteria)]
MAEKFDYLESQADADELIEEFGQVGAIRRATIERENPWDEAEETIADYPVTLVPLPIAEERIDGTLILRGDKQVLISAEGLGITIVAGDIVMFNGAFVGAEYVGGETWTIKDPGKFDPSSVTVVYDAVARR